MRRQGPNRFYGLCVDLSGIIFVVLALAWAVYLVPKALKHHDEMARTRSIDRFSTAMRVLARREPVSPRETRLVVTPPRPDEASKVLLPSAKRASDARPAAVRDPRRVAVRRAARAAARRRRRVLAFLVVLDALTVTAAALGYLPWWSVSVPVTLTVLYLYLCRRQVRRGNDATWGEVPRVHARRELSPRRAIRVDATYGAARAVAFDQGVTTFSPDQDTATISTRAVEAQAGGAPAADNGSLWDPLPVTLPTYVNKSRAPRTVRTIDLTEPGAWTSGRSTADTMLVEQASAVEEEATVAPEEQRAVGS